MFKNIFLLYYDGFRSMTLGRTLWALILLKLFIIFAVMKTFFLPDVLATRYATDAERAEHVLSNLISPDPKTLESGRTLNATGPRQIP